MRILLPVSGLLPFPAHSTVISTASLRLSAGAPTCDRSLLPRVLCNLVADVTDTVSDMCNGAARSMDNTFPGPTSSIRDAFGRAASVQHQGARQHREQ
jgi:hypothetical protein